MPVNPLHVYSTESLREELKRRGYDEPDGGDDADDCDDDCSCNGACPNFAIDAGPTFVAVASPTFYSPLFKQMVFNDLHELAFEYYRSIVATGEYEFHSERLILNRLFDATLGNGAVREVMRIADGPKHNG